MMRGSPRFGVELARYAAPPRKQLRECVDVSSPGNLPVGSDANFSPNCAVPIAVIDGPYDEVALSEVLPRSPVRIVESDCAVSPNNACAHGTFIVGMLGARGDAVIPGLCPELTPVAHSNFSR